MTPREHQLLGFIKGYIKQNDFAPTFEEMRIFLGQKSKSSGYKMVQSLIRQQKLVTSSSRPLSERNLALAGELKSFSTAELRAELVRRGELSA